MDPTEPVVPPTTDGEIQQTPAIKLPKDQVPCTRCTSQEIALQRKCGFNHIHLPSSLGQTTEGGASAPPKSKPQMDQVRCGKCDSLDAALKKKCGFNHDHLPASLGQTTNAVTPTVTEIKLEENTPTEGKGKTGGAAVKKACRDFASGSCPRGAACNFSHVAEVVVPIPEVKHEKKGKGNNKPVVPIVAEGSNASLEAGGVKTIVSEKDVLTALVAKVLAGKVTEVTKKIRIECIEKEIDVLSLTEEDLQVMINLSFSSSIPKPKGKGKKGEK
jgi:hypothetical protein